MTGRPYFLLLAVIGAAFVAVEARRRGLTGVALKEEGGVLGP